MRSALSVGKGPAAILVAARVAASAAIQIGVQFTSFQNLAAIEALEILRVVVFGDQLRARVFTG